MIERVVYLNQTVEATAVWFDGGNVVQPSNPNLWPAWAVRDTDEKIVSFGVATLGLDNQYHASFTIPSTSTLSTPEKKWVIEWVLVDSANREWRSTEYFDVAHPTFSEVDLKEQQKLVLKGQNLSLKLPLPSQPVSIGFTLFDQQGTTQVWSPPTPPALSGTWSDFYVYETSLPTATLLAGTYAGLWSWTYPGGVVQTLFNKVNVVTFLALSFISDLRMMLDKVTKPVELWLGYRDSDLFFYVTQGLLRINMIPPPTNWTLETINGPVQDVVKMPLVLAAMSFALNAQFLAEADQAFSYAGQAVTLEVDRTSLIESELSRIDEYLKDWETQKKILVNTGAWRTPHLGLTLPTVSRRAGSSGISAIALDRAPWLK